MSFRATNTAIKNVICSLIFSIGLYACGGGGGSDSTSPTITVPNVTLTYSRDTCTEKSQCTVDVAIPSGVTQITVESSDSAKFELTLAGSSIASTNTTDTSATFSVSESTGELLVTFNNSGEQSVWVSDYTHDGFTQNQSNMITNISVNQITQQRYSFKLEELEEYKSSNSATGYWMLLRNHVQIASIEAYLNDVDSADCRIDNSNEKIILEFEIGNFANCYNYGGENKVHLKVSHNGTSDLALEDVLEVKDYHVNYDTLTTSIYLDAKGVIFGVSDSANSNALLNALSLTNFYVNVKSDTSLPSGNYTVKIVYQPETDNITLLEEGITYQESSESNVMQLSGIPDLGYGISNLREMSMVVTDSDGTDFQLEFVSADVHYAYNGVTANVNKAEWVEKLKFVKVAE